MKKRKNNKKWANSKTEFLSLAEKLSKSFNDNRNYFNMLRTSYLLRDTDQKINPEKVQEKFRLLQSELRGLSKEFKKAKSDSKYFPDISQKFFSNEIRCGSIIAEIYDYLPIPG